MAEAPIVRSGRSWVVLDQSPINGKAFSLATDPHNAGRLYAYGLGAIFRSDDFGQTWPFLSQDLQDLYSLFVDPLTPDRLYARSLDGLWKSDDAGAAWQKVASPVSSVASLVVDAAGVLFASGPEGFFRSTTAGDNWSRVTSFPCDVQSTFCPGAFISADPKGPGVLYGDRAYRLGGNSIFKTTDGALTWTGPLLSASLTSAVTDVKVSATVPTIVYALINLHELSACSGAVLASSDGGGTWKTIFRSASVGPIAADPTRPDVSYVGTSPCGSSSDLGGVYQLSSTGRSALLGQSGFAVYSLAVAPDGSTLYAIAAIAPLGKFATFHLPSRQTPATIPFR